MAKITRRGLIRGLFTLVAIEVPLGFAAYKYFEPDRSLPENLNDDMTPNPIQLALIRRLAEKYDYTVFGDTDHRRHEIRRFCFNDSMARTLVDAGLDRFMIEAMPELSPYIGEFQAAVRDGRGGSADFVNSCVENLYADWYLREEPRRIFCDSMAEAIINNPSLDILPVDVRLSRGIGFSIDGPGQAFRLLSFMNSIALYKALYGGVTVEALEGLGRVFGEDVAGKFVQAMLDDQHTADYIRELQLPGRAAIFYGAGHFNNLSAADLSEGHERNLRHLLQQDGKTMGIINVFADEKQKAEYQAMCAELSAYNPDWQQAEPDVELFVSAPESAPDGVNIINPEVASIYRALQRDVASSGSDIPALHSPVPAFRG